MRTEPAASAIASRDNPLLKRLRKLAHDPAAYRKLGQVWIEGEHLCAAARARGVKAVQALVTLEAYQRETTLRTLAHWAAAVATAPAALFDGVSSLESAASVGFVIEHGASPEIDPTAATVVLDRVQDAGNVGSILRTAAAMGVCQVLAIKGTAALWSPKVLRAGMGAHFGLRLVESLEVDALDALRVPLLATGSHAGVELAQARLPSPCAWVFGHEGQGVQPALAQRCAFTVRIAQPGGEESLNVAAAAAICLYASRCEARADR